MSNFWWLPRAKLFLEGELFTGYVGKNLEDVFFYASNSKPWKAKMSSLPHIVTKWNRSCGCNSRHEQSSESSKGLQACLYISVGGAAPGCLTQTLSWDAWNGCQVEDVGNACLWHLFHHTEQCCEQQISWEYCSSMVPILCRKLFPMKCYWVWSCLMQF